jgi:uncharacterized protein (DUF58 family)
MDAGNRNLGQEFFCLREYQQGEDARNVHAPSSARFGELVSKSHRGDFDQEITLVLDLRRKPGSFVPINSHDLEHQLKVTATLIDQLCIRGRRLHCYTLDGNDRRWVIDSTPASKGLLTFLAEAKTVSYYSLDSSALPDFATVDNCLWIPAGGYLQGSPTGAQLISERSA